MKKALIFILCFIAYSGINAQWYNYYSSGNDLKSVLFVDSFTGWAVGAQNTIIKTQNGGNNWIVQNSKLPNPINLNSVFFYDNQNGFIACDNSFGTSLILKTTDGGTNWQAIYMPVSDYSFTKIYFKNIGVSNFLGFVCGYDSASNSGIILKTTDLGNTWIQTYSGTGKIKCLELHNSNFGFAGGDKLLKTSDGGDTWDELSLLTNINDINFISVNNGWICTQSGKLYRTINSGDSWEEQLQNNNIPLNSLYFQSSSLGWISTGDGKIFNTTNAGNTWVKQITDFTKSIYAIAMTSGTNGVSVCEGGVVLRTNNGGGPFGTFTQVFRHSDFSKPIYANATTLDTIKVDSLINEENITVTGIKIFIDTVLNSVDSNLTFVLTHCGINDTVIYKVGGSGNNFIGTILSDDANQQIENGHAPFTGTYKPSRPLSILNNTKFSGKWILSIYHTGYEAVNNPLLTGVIKSWGIAITYNRVYPLIMGNGNNTSTTASKYTLSQNYPNPFNPVTKIQYSVPVTSFVTMKIYDIMGREVATLVSAEMKKGSYSVSFDGSKLGSGIYFCKMATNEFSDTKKMILIK